MQNLNFKHNFKITVRNFKNRNFNINTHYSTYLDFIRIAVKMKNL